MRGDVLCDGKITTALALSQLPRTGRLGGSLGRLVVVVVAVVVVVV